MENKPALYMSAAAFSAVFMGTMGTLASYSGLSAVTMTFFRLFLGVLLMTLFLLCTGQLDLIRRKPSWQVLLCGILLVSFIVFYVKSMSHTSMANAIFTIYLAPVVASVSAHFFFKERLNLFSGLLILCALLGFAMMREFRLDFSGGSDEASGLILAGISMLCYAGYILINRQIPSHVHVYTRTWYQMAAGSLCILPFMLRSIESIAAEQWLWLFLAGLFPGFLAVLFAVLSLQNLPSATFGTLAYLEPISVVVLGWGLFGQSLNPLQISGCALIIAAGVLRASIPPIKFCRTIKPCRTRP